MGHQCRKYAAFPAELMQSKESRACEAGGYLGRFRRVMPMQVYIYICWQLELLGNANLRLYQCWFAFTH